MEIVTVVARDVKSLPYQWGREDAVSRQTPCPELYFVRPEQICEYCRGFESAVGPTPTTRLFLDIEISLAGDAKIEDTLDLEEAIVESEYLRSWH